MMPTQRRRYTITADERVEVAIARSRRRFPPGTSDSKILAALVSKGNEAFEQEGRTDADREERRRAAASRLSARFRRSDGFDYEALAEASARWLSG